MVSPHEKLAESLEKLCNLQDRGVVAGSFKGSYTNPSEAPDKKRLFTGSNERLVYFYQSGGV